MATTGVWGMVSGDGDASGTIANADKLYQSELYISPKWIKKNVIVRGNTYYLLIC